MSAVSLRQILEAELAALSDCDEDDDTYDNLDSGDEEVDSNRSIRHGLSIDEETNIASLDEWKLLLASYEQADKRFEGLQLSFTDGFDGVVRSQVTDQDESPNKSAGQKRNALVSAIDDESYGSPIASSHRLDVSESVSAKPVAVQEVCETADQEAITQELKEIIQYMIEAIERSAPIIRASVPKFAVTVIDLSLLPQLIGDDDQTKEIASISSSREYNLYSDLNSYSESNGNNVQAKRTAEINTRLREVENNLLTDADSAIEKALQRKKLLQARKLLMEEELAIWKRLQSLILIQSKWRQYRCRKSYVKYVESLKREREQHIEVDRRKREIEEEATKLQESSRLRGIENEMIRVAVKAEEDRLREEEKEAEKEREAEKEKEALRIAEAAAALEEFNKMQQVKEGRLALELEVKREQQEIADMHLMESEGRLAWEREKQIESENAIQYVLCLPCTAKVRKRMSKEVLKTRQCEYDNDEVEVEEGNEEKEDDEEEEEDEGERITGQAERLPLSVEEMASKMKDIKALEVHWMSRIERVAAAPSGIHFVHGIQAPDVADLVGILGSEGHSVIATLKEKDNSTDHMQHSHTVSNAAARGVGDKGSVETQGCTLYESLQSYQRWAVESKLFEKKIERRPPQSTVLSQSNIVPSPPTSEDIAQLVSFGLRPLDLSSPPSEFYPDISLCVESLTSCSFLRALSGLKRLQLNVNKLRDLKGLESLTSLEELSVKDNALCCLDAVSRLKSLRVLSVDDNLLNTDGLTALADLPNLHNLSANTNKLNVFPLLSGCPALQRLHLYHNSITCIPSSALSALPSLTHLDLGRNKLEYVCGSALSQCPLLQTLVLSQNLLTAPPSPLYLPNLRNLWLSSNRLHSLDCWLPTITENTESSNSANAISWPLFLPLLEKMHLSDNSLSDIDATAMCNLPLLTDLDISFNNLSTSWNLRGLKSIPRLSVLQLHDNPVYRSDAPGVADSGLVSWLIQECTSLLSISGNVIDPSSRHTNVVSGVCNVNHASAGVSVFSFVNRGQDADVKQRVAMLKRYAKTGQWGSSKLSSLTASHQSNRMMESKLSIGHVSTDEGVNRTGNYLVSNSTSSNLSQRLVQTFLNINLEQNVLKAREKIENVRTKYVTNVPVPPPITASSEIAEGIGDGSIDWGVVIVEQFRSHAMLLMSWRYSELRSSHALCPVIWLSERPVSRPIYEDVIAHTEEHSAEQSDLSSPASVRISHPSALNNVAPSQVHHGMVRLQAVWRSRKVRTHIRNVMLTVRYQDDELEELLGDENENFNLAETLEGCEEYLAPITLRGRWQPNPQPYSSRAQRYDPKENLHGTRMVKALAGGWVDGRILSDSPPASNEEDVDESQSMNGSRKASFVYGDHRRRKLSLKEVHLEPLPNRHAAYDGPDSRMSEFSHPPSPQGCSHLFSHSASADWTSRPSTALTETSSLSGASSRAHSVPDLVLDRHAPHNYYNNNVQPKSRKPISNPLRTKGLPSSPPSSSSSLREDKSQTDEWGIRDPKVLQAMLKRNKRMTGFANAQGKRDREKDSQGRYQRSAKNAARGGSSASTEGTTMSWGGGGAAGACSSTGSGRGRGGMGKGGGRFKSGRKSLPPAWALAARQDNSDGYGGVRIEEDEDGSGSGGGGDG